MRNTRIFFAYSAFFVFFFAGTHTASAQVYQGTWFKLGISVKGNAVDTLDESADKLKIKTTAYMYVWPGGGGYEYDIFSEVEPDNWQITADGTLPPFMPTFEQIFIRGAAWPINLPDDTIIVISLSGEFKAKLDKTSGRLKNASFTSIGAYLVDGMSPDDIPIFGGAKIKGKTIDQEKLPFDPPE